MRRSARELTLRQARPICDPNNRPEHRAALRSDRAGGLEVRAAKRMAGLHREVWQGAEAYLQDERKDW